MLDEIGLSSFKCFESQRLRLGRLTVLSGTNSAGKSSVLQALTLLSLVVRSTPWKAKCELNHPGLQLGSVSDVINYGSSRTTAVIGLASGNERVEFGFAAADRQSLSLRLASVRIADGATERDFARPDDVPLPAQTELRPVRSLRRTKWISSERVGPRDVLPLEDEGSVLSVGHDGANAAALLYWNEDREVSERVVLPNVPNTLFNQVRARLRTIFPQSDFRVVRIDNAVAVSLSFRTGAGSEYRRPQNVGFGYSQVFPILVELLFASPGDLVLIENPEIHLHPRAQQELATFVAQAAASGVQVVVETHSDHVLNGIRLAVRRGQIPSGDVALHFFSPSEQGVPTVASPTLNTDAKLSAWPEGFFDQYDQALAELL